MKLKKLLKDIPVKEVKGSKEVEITGICGNSKLVAPGNLFIARRGKSDDGADYIPEAVAAGAAAIVTDIYDPSIKTVTQIIHPEVGQIEALLAAHYYQFASDELFMVGITGTNGKTTTSFMIKHLLDRIVGSCGLIGTIEYIIGQHRYPAIRTTPDVTSNHKMLREMLNQGCRAAVMEVTSHALDQGRTANIEFDIAVFTNLSLDHLDYHQTMENYAQEKNKLFRSLDPATQRKKAFSKTAIVNVDSPWHIKMLEGCKARIITYGIEGQADVRAEDIKLSSSGTVFKITYKGASEVCHWPLIGRFNVYNCLAAIAVGLARGLPLKEIVSIMQVFPAVPGRLEAVPNDLGLKIYVDFAHSDDALANVLESLQELKTGRIITVFGCGGDRDKSKRSKMGQVCEELSTISIVTSDNPRSEEPDEIIRQIITGFKKRSSFLVEADRRAAIAKAIEIATQEDIILIAGKGHEAYQVFAHKTIEFDDRKVASQLCKQKARQPIIS